MRDDCTGIEGMEPEEAEALICALADHIVKPAFTAIAGGSVNSRCGTIARCSTARSRTTNCRSAG